MIHIIGGGTFNHVRSHLSLAAFAKGTTAKRLYKLFKAANLYNGKQVVLHLTTMADPTSTITTNEDVSKLVDQLVADPQTSMIVMNAALCDFEGQVGDIQSGKYAERLQSRTEGQTIQLTQSDKLISRIRKTRKDIFVVGFKTTTGASFAEQYAAGLRLLKQNSVNLVVANDTLTRQNIIVTPEESHYGSNLERDSLLGMLVNMAHSRSKNTFTRSTVLAAPLVPWRTSSLIPDNLREVVDHMVRRGAYKPFNGATVGHFAVKVDDNRVLTSRRKTDYTKDGGLDLVEIEYDGLDKVIAYGAKPSVGGQSQRIIFDQYPELDCIAHAHIPMRPDAPDQIGHAQQWANECGSHQCGENTAKNLISDQCGIYAVMLENHGPNIVFNRNIDAAKVIDFIERNFDLELKTGGLIPA